MPAKDPIQQKLRDRKKAWNKQIRDFTSDLIAIKKVMNGSASKFNNSISKITNPIPGNPGTILSDLLSDFQNIISEGNEIVNEQSLYAKSKKQATASLNTFSSNEFSRFVSKFKGPVFFGSSDLKKQRILRLNILKSCADIEKEIKDLQGDILSSGNEDNIKKTKSSTQDIQKKLYQIVNQLNEYMKLSYSDTQVDHPQKKVEDHDDGDSDGARHYPLDDVSILNKKDKHIDSSDGLFPRIPESDSGLSQEDLKIKALVNDFLLNKDSFSFTFASSIVNYFNTNITVYFNTDDEYNKDQAKNNIITCYTTLLEYANSHSKTNGKSFNEIVLTREAATKTHLEIYAHNTLTKWINRKLTQMSVSDKTSFLRLKVDELLSDSKSIVNSLMDELEKDKPVDLVFARNQLKSVIKNMQVVYRLLDSLSGKRFVGDWDPDVLSTVVNQIGPHHLSDEQKSRLKRNLEIKQVNQLAKNFGNVQ